MEHEGLVLIRARAADSPAKVGCRVHVRAVAARGGRVVLVVHGVGLGDTRGPFGMQNGGDGRSVASDTR